MRGVWGMLFKKVFLSAVICIYSVFLFGAEAPPNYDFGKQYNLVEAIQAQDIGRVQQLLGEGANPNIGVTVNGIPLKIAAIDVINPDIVALLLQAGADPNISVGIKSLIINLIEGSTRAAYSMLPDPNVLLTLRSRQKAIIKMLLENPKIDINQRDDIGSILHHAINKEDLHEFVPLILRNPSLNPNTKDHLGYTPLMRAVMYLHVNEALPLIRLLLNDKRVDINETGNNGKTALDLAKRSKKITDLLLKNDALPGKEQPQQPKKPSFAQQGPQFAYRTNSGGQPSFTPAGPNAQPSGFGATSGQPRFTGFGGIPAQPAFQTGAAQSLEDQLIDAVNRNDINQARSLLAAGANPNAIIKSGPLVGDPIFIYAVIRGSLPIIKEFLSRPQLNPNITDNIGRTALIIASIVSNVEIVSELLKDSRINVNLRTTTMPHLSALDFAENKIDELGSLSEKKYKQTSEEYKQIAALLKLHGATSTLQQYRNPKVWEAAQRAKAQQPPFGQYQQTYSPFGATPQPQPVFKPADGRPDYGEQIYKKLGVKLYASPYDILGISPSAPASEIKEAFKKRTFQWHPDKNSDPDARYVFDLAKWANDWALKKIGR